MLLTENKHYTRREEQPLPLPKPSRIILGCLLCQQLVDSELGTKRKSNNDGKGFRLEFLRTSPGCGWSTAIAKEWRLRAATDTVKSDEIFIRMLEFGV